jgi:hypothetical protein
MQFFTVGLQARYGFMAKAVSAGGFAEIMDNPISK